MSPCSSVTQYPYRSSSIGSSTPSIRVAKKLAVSVFSSSASTSAFSSVSSFSMRVTRVPRVSSSDRILSICWCVVCCMWPIFGFRGLDKTLATREIERVRESSILLPSQLSISISLSRSSIGIFPGVSSIITTFSAYLKCNLIDFILSYSSMSWAFMYSYVGA